jgi:ferric-dicitrate binding protein FerR (iron transport regulator)
MSEDRLYILLAKILCKEATPAEIVDFQLLISENQESKEQFNNLEELWGTPASDANSSEESEEAFLIHIAKLKDLSPDFAELNHHELDTESEDFQLYPTKAHWYQRWQSLAAFLVFIVFTVSAYQLYSHKKSNELNGMSQFNEIKVSLGTKTKVQLPDGSKVWVNSDSKLSYPEAFKGHTREIYLEGEAYFDVVKDPKHPFIVHTSGIDIRVLGTAFNVKAYKAESTIEATLVHGLIEVTKTEHPNESKIILHPHEKLIFDKLAKEERVINHPAASTEKLAAKYSLPSPAIIISPFSKNIADSAIKETSWIYNRLTFEDERFEDLVIKIERWFNVHITISNEKIKSFRATGSFENETIDEALKELQYLVPFNYQLNGREIMITKN